MNPVKVRTREAGLTPRRTKMETLGLMARPAPHHPREFGDWETRAAAMAAKAECMPPGPQRDEALRKARQLAEAAWMRRTLAPKPSET